MPRRSDVAVRNRRRAGLVAVAGGAGPGIVLGAVIAGVVGWPVGLTVFCVVTGVVALLIWYRSTAVALRLLGAVPCLPEDQPRLFNVTEGLCATFGLRVPELWVVDDPVPNACTLGRSAHEALLVVTSGLLERLDLIELEGLVAHELAHVKRHETVLAGIGVVVLWPYARLSGRDDLLRSLLGPGREYRADQLAAATVRYPPGLRDALGAMAEGPAPSPGSVFAAPRLAMTRWLWVDPDPGPGRRDGRQGIEALEVRIAALTEW